MKAKKWKLVLGWILLACGVIAMDLIFLGIGLGLLIWHYNGKKKVEAPMPEIPTPETPTPAPMPEAPAPAQVKPVIVANVKTYKVTGMSHRMENLMALAEENDDYQLSKKALIKKAEEYADLTGGDPEDQRIWQYEFYPHKTELVPEPDNPVDPNAIKVVIDGQHVGYIKSGSCAHLLKVIREGRIGRIGCQIGGGKYKYIDEDYNEDGDSIYTLEKDELAYFVHLKIEEL